MRQLNLVRALLMKNLLYNLTHLEVGLSFEYPLKKLAEVIFKFSFACA